MTDAFNFENNEETAEERPYRRQKSRAVQAAYKYDSDTEMLARTLYAEAVINALPAALGQPKRDFLIALYRTGNIARACAAVDLPRSTIYSWRDSDPVFAQTWDEAIEHDTDDLEYTLVQRAQYEPGMPGVVATIATLKARRPQKWSEKHIVVDPQRDAFMQLAERFFQAMGPAQAAPALPSPSIVEGRAVASEPVGRAEDAQQTTASEPEATR